jgi:hypothetical protein
MYRIWLVSVLFGSRYVDGFDDYSEEYPEGCGLQLEESWKDQKSFLQQFSTQEVFQIDCLARYLVFTANWATTAEDDGSVRSSCDVYDWNGMFLFAGPHIILRCVEDVTSNHLPTEYIGDDGPYTEFIQKALSQIFEERHVTVPVGYLELILDTINGGDVQCRHCNDNAGIARLTRQARRLSDLYNETRRVDWEFLVPHNLSSNLVERPLMQALRGDWSKLLHEMFACKGNEYAQWSKEDWICVGCWSTFVWDTSWRWRLVQKKKAGERLKRDCKYGYDCKEQCWDSGLAHAKQFNHLCNPMVEYY